MQAVDRVIFFVQISACGTLVDLCATEGTSCHFSCTFQRAILAALCCAESICRNGVYLCLFVSLNFVFLPIYAEATLVVSATKQVSDGIRR